MIEKANISIIDHPPDSQSLFLTKPPSHIIFSMVIIMINFLILTLLAVLKAQLQRKAFKQLKLKKQQIRNTVYFHRNI